MALDALDGTWNVPDHDFADGKDNDANDCAFPNNDCNNHGSRAATVRRVG